MENNQNFEFDLIDAASLRRMGDLLLQYLWLIVLLVCAGAGISFAISASQPKIFSSAVQIIISKPSISSQVQDLTQLLSTQQIIETYVQMAQLESVRTEVESKLQIQLKESDITVKSIPDTQIIELRAEGKTPEMAQSIATAYVDVLIKKNNDIQLERYQSNEESLSAQLSDMEKQIEEQQQKIKNRFAEVYAEQQKQLEDHIAALNIQIDTLQKEIAQENTPENISSEELAGKKSQLDRAINQLQSYESAYTNLTTQNKLYSLDDKELTSLNNTLNLYQQIYLNLLNNRENLRLTRVQNTLNIIQLENASINNTPIRPQIPLNTMLGGLAGLLVAISLIFIRDYLDDTLKTRDDIKRLTGLQIVTPIPTHPVMAEQGLFVAVHPRAPVSEAYRALRTNLDFASVDQPVKLLLVTSAGPGEGKTTIATNLAGVLAQSGKNVLLIDTDLRRPNVHKVLNLNNRFGLSDLFVRNLKVSDVTQNFNGPNGTNFRVITTGAIPPNPAELLSSTRMQNILLDAMGQANIIILDSAPLLVADSQILSRKVDGIILVIQSGQTHAEPVRVMLEGFQAAHARILGAVLNRAHQRSGYYNNNYYHYQAENKPVPFWRRMFKQQ